ncbi:lysophospholipid acyltransferase family protein [Rickettsiales endosymbiont of Trichoplax sp. H2]|uniref:lysophospholipid acyltransferase family protein n=1 Tax=Rickettsiales endosymbiont of Trichoplax sp. H2 TaxID=2021221 RepID=UPI0012B3E11B|nr:lysophospholipid acyltransferase family protein [Rickettsiales endosymbiont of Trichoplax sp. H2]MSO13659.1 Lipid A biosynthesis lauroyltransferase [Rickettsiales endosymbiont of Trichoplax sp. H2]
MKLHYHIKRILYLIEALIVYFFYYIFRILKIELASKVAGNLVILLSKFFKENNVAKQNIKMCLPNTTLNCRERIIKNTWKHFGSIIGELPHWNLMNKIEFFSRVTITNKKYFPRSKAIIVSGHIGNWELIGRIAKEYNTKLNLVYRPSNNPYINKLINKIRSENNINLIPKGTFGVKMILKAINNNEIVGIMIDQKISDGINVKFFNKNAMTTALPANIALKYNIPIIAAYIVKVGEVKYKATFCKPLDINTSDTKHTIMRKINQILEKWIKQHPEQWFWFHNRWKK